MVIGLIVSSIVNCSLHLVSNEDYQAHISIKNDPWLLKYNRSIHSHSSLPVQRWAECVIVLISFVVFSLLYSSLLSLSCRSFRSEKNRAAAKLFPTSPVRQKDIFFPFFAFSPALMLRWWVRARMNRKEEKYRLDTDRGGGEERRVCIVFVWGEMGERGNK